MSGPPKEKTRDEIDMKLLRELAALPANKTCFDCGQRGPTYVNVTIGSFVCSACGGLLRGLNPPHRVKSLTVCSFTELEMDRIKSRGNEYCTHIWLGKCDGKSDSADLSSPDKRKEFMILKYEEKKFYVDPREAIKKMKPRAPAAPSIVSVPRSQTALPNKQSTQIQRPGVSQAFSAGDISSNAKPNIIQSFGRDPFQEIKKENGDAASFADFSSAFGDTGSKDFPPFQPPTSVASSTSHKKPAPPPPDRYAALADLDNQLHQPSEPSATVPFWSSPTFVASGVQNPFQTPQPWPQTVPCSQNPFQIVAQPAVSCRNVVLPSQNSNGTPNSAANPSLPNGNVGAVYWPPVSSQPWSGQIPSSQAADPFASKSTSVIGNYNPWAQSFGTSSANPFENGTSSTASSRNPFL